MNNASGSSEPEHHGPFGLVVASTDRPTAAPPNWTNWLLLMVPLFIAEMRELPDDEIARLREENVDLITAHGDDAQFGGSQRAGGRNAIAKGLALMARADGGVTALGVHACLRPHIGCPGRFTTSPAPAHPDAEK
ncbi:hypothetical protein ACIBEA_38830 [Streptomyces sp. NPDC051555]|uniref:hypothetical protein n=1 Tax=Streptomyces sp. NPDC051555 TaxID=3365657 RepID=UPI0037B94C7E